MTVQEIQTMIRQNMVLYRNVAKPLTDKEADTVSDAPGLGIQGFVPGKVQYLG